MAKLEDKETRYFVDLDLGTQKILRWDYDQRCNITQELRGSQHRIFITKGQYNKLVDKYSELSAGRKA